MQNYRKHFAASSSGNSWHAFADGSLVVHLICNLMPLLAYGKSNWNYKTIKIQFSQDRIG